MKRRLLLALVLATTGCERRARPWEGKPGDDVVDASQPFLGEGRDGRWLGGAPGASGTASSERLDLGGLAGEGGSSGDGAERATPAPTRAGGLWRSCWQGFAPGGDPRRDLERLSAICGPPNGMRPLGEALEGTATPLPSVHPMPVRAGSCYRLFGVADAGVEDLDVRVTSVRGSRLASDEENGRVSLVDADRAFCSFADETLTIEVAARGGSGRYALRIYQLPAER